MSRLRNLKSEIRNLKSPRSLAAATARQACLLPPASRLRPTADCLLLTAYCLLFSFCSLLASAQSAESPSFRVTTHAVPESGGSPTTADTRALVSPTLRTVLTMGRIGDAPKTTASFRIHEGYVPTLKFPPPAASAILSPDGIPTSPGFVEVRVPADVTGVTVTPDGGTPVTMTRLSPLRAFGFIPLSSVGGASGPDPTGYTVRDGVGGPIVSGSLTWAATDLAGRSVATNSLRIRAGDSLLLTATGGGGTLEIDGDGDGAFEHVGTPGQRFPHAYPFAGIFTARARINGSEVGSLRVAVVAVDLHGPIASEVAFRREKDVVVDPAGEASTVNYGADDFSGMFVAVQSFTATGAALVLEPRARGTPVLVARLGGPSGPVLAHQMVDEFTLDVPARTDVLVNDDTDVGTSHITIRPYIPNLRFEFNMFASQSTFAGGVTLFSANTSDFAQVLDPATGETVGEFLYDIEVPDTASFFCFNLTGFQAGSGEEEIATQPGVNGRVCKARVQEITLCVCGPSAPLRMELTSQADAGSHAVLIVGNPATAPVFTAPDNRTDSTTWERRFFCMTSALHPDPNQVAHDVKAQSGTGKFGVKIKDTEFADVITVDPFTIKFTAAPGGAVGYPLVLTVGASCGGADITGQIRQWQWIGAPPNATPSGNSLTIPAQPEAGAYSIAASGTCDGVTVTTDMGYTLTVTAPPDPNPGSTGGLTTPPPAGFTKAILSVLSNQNVILDETTESLQVSQEVTNNPPPLDPPNDALGFSDTAIINLKDFRIQVFDPNAAGQAEVTVIFQLRTKGSGAFRTKNVILNNVDGAGRFRGTFYRLVTDVADLDSVPAVAEGPLVINLGPKSPSDPPYEAQVIYAAQGLSRVIPILRPATEDNNDQPPATPQKHDVRQVPLRFHAFVGSGMITESIDIAIANINARWWQAGIQVAPNPAMDIGPNEIPLPASLTDHVFNNSGENIAFPTQDETDVFTLPASRNDNNPNTVDIWVLPTDVAIPNAEAISYRLGRVAGQPQIYWNNMVVGAHTVTHPLVLSHELMHILLNLSHDDRPPARENEHSLLFVVVGADPGDRVDGPKRIGDFSRWTPRTNGHPDAIECRRRAEQLSEP